MFRRCGDEPEVLLVHPGGPFWSKRDLGAWSVPKGEYNAGEDPLVAARREFAEETGIVPEGEFLALKPLRQADCDPITIISNTFVMEWPPRSGRQREFPEVDRAAWFPLGEAKKKLLAAQVSLIEELAHLLEQRERRD